MKSKKMLFLFKFEKKRFIIKQDISQMDTRAMLDENLKVSIPEFILPVAENFSLDNSNFGIQKSSVLSSNIKPIKSDQIT